MDYAAVDWQTDKVNKMCSVYRMTRHVYNFTTIHVLQLYNYTRSTWHVDNVYNCTYHDK